MNSEKKETIHEWDELNDGQKILVTEAHSQKMNGRQRKTLYRIFNLGKPKIVFVGNMEQCRIHESSVDVIKVLVRQYLK